MKQLLLICALVGLWTSAVAQIDTGRALTINGMPVEFVSWRPQEPAFGYADLAIAPERKDAVDEQDADFVEPLFRADLTLRADGRIEETRVITRLLNNPSAVREAGNISFWVDAYSQHAVIEQAYTLLPDGRRIDVDPVTLQVLADSDDDVFTDSYQVVVPFPGLTVDAIAVLVTKTERKAGLWPLPWSRIFFPQIFRPREAFEVNVRWETGGVVPQWRSDLDDLDCRREGPRALSCSARHLAARPWDQNIYYRDVLPTLVISERTTWQGLGLLVRSLFEPALMQDDGLEDVLDDLLADATSIDESLSRIHRFVAQEIRYVGLEAGLGGIVPRPVETTLERRFGDCKDKTALFVAMVNHIGIGAYPVLTTFERFDSSKLLLPAASYFDHMVACVRLPDGRETCYDLTDPHTPSDQFSHSLHGAIRLDLTNEMREPVHFGKVKYRWIYDVSTQNRFQDDGLLEERQTRIYSEGYGVDMRAGLQRRSTSERLEWARDDYQTNVSNRVEPSLELDGVDDTSRPVTIRSVAKYPQLFDPADYDNYVDEDVWLAAEARSVKTTNSHYPYNFSGLRYRSETTFLLPSNWRVEHRGAQINFVAPYGYLRRRVNATDDGLVVITELAMPAARIAVGEIQRFNRFLDHVAEQSKLHIAIDRK